MVDRRQDDDWNFGAMNADTMTRQDGKITMNPLAHGRDGTPPTTDHPSKVRYEAAPLLSATVPPPTIMLRP